jgi:gluconolactonase
MKRIFFPFFLTALSVPAFSQETKPPGATIEFVSDELAKVINKDAKVEIVADGFQFTEGPLWVEKEKMLLFSDVPGNTIYKWTEAKGKEVYIKPAGYTAPESRGGFMGPNGLALSTDGKLLICQHGDRRVARMDAPLNAPKASFVSVAAEYNGKKINSPNDLIVMPNGDVYFTDPAYGFERGANDPKKELTFQGVYKVNKAGQITLLVDSIEAPNGIGLMPDKKTMIVSNSDGRKKRWYAYDVASNGSLSNGRVFFDVSSERGAGGCDGLKIDKQGNLFATGPGGVYIINKSGKLIGRIRNIPAANLAFTPDEKTLFITAGNNLLRVKLR